MRKWVEGYSYECLLALREYDGGLCMLGTGVRGRGGAGGEPWLVGVSGMGWERLEV